MRQRLHPGHILKTWGGMFSLSLDWVVQPFMNLPLPFLFFFPSSLKYNVIQLLSMASEQEVRSKAQNAGLNKNQEDQAVTLARNDPNLTADQVIQQVKNK
jgi:hypothetical protein